MSEIRVRFAPSPTGLLHIGGSRTALYDYLFAKKEGGKFILRIEDTDLERSTKASEESIINDLKWLGIDFDEGPGKEGKFGPYRQSERLSIYKELSDDLVKQGKAYPCFLTSLELEELSEKAAREKKAPHAYHGKFRDLDPAVAKKRIDDGESYVIRFRNPQEEYRFCDLVRGEVVFGPDMVGDFIIMRSNGMPVYNFCCVIDDFKMKISHVFRAEEHLPNTLRQLILYKAFNQKPPYFAHCSLLVGADRQKLSKRHAATSVDQYRQQGFLPQAMNNYLCLLGWSHPDETDIFTNEEVCSLFEINRFNKAPALYDIEKLKYFNEQHLRQLDEEQLFNYVNAYFTSDQNSSDNKEFKFYNSQSFEWKKQLITSFKEKVQLPSSYLEYISLIEAESFDVDQELKDVFSWETTKNMIAFLDGEIKTLMSSGEQFCTQQTFESWMTHLKKELKIKGKFLFKGARGVLTMKGHGPDLKHLIPLTPLVILLKRIDNASRM